MPPEDYYNTIEASLRAPEMKVKGSRFIADFIPVKTKDDVESALDHIRKEFYDATHHCFAYRLGPEGLLVRAADDGEPHGSAGKPILLVLTAQKITDVLLVVTRYFGGTKLGTGGLARAYAEAAQQVVSLSHVVRVYLTSEVNITVLYEDLPALERLVKAFQGTIEESTYLESVTLRVAIRRSRFEQFLQSITETFHGRAGVMPAVPTAIRP
jgi:uncharacterized YigZ family protein